MDVFADHVPSECRLYPHNACNHVRVSQLLHEELVVLLLTGLRTGILDIVIVNLTIATAVAHLNIL